MCFKERLEDRLVQIGDARVVETKEDRSITKSSERCGLETGSVQHRATDLNEQHPREIVHTDDGSIALSKNIFADSIEEGRRHP